MSAFDRDLSEVQAAVFRLRSQGSDIGYLYLDSYPVVSRIGRHWWSPATLVTDQILETFVVLDQEWHGIEQADTLGPVEDTQRSHFSHGQWEMPDELDTLVSLVELSPADEALALEQIFAGYVSR